MITPHLAPRVALAAALAGLAASSAMAQVTFTPLTTIGTQTEPFVNNLIDLNLADFANGVSGQALPSYTTTTSVNIFSNTVTRSNLTQGSLLTVAEFNNLIAVNRANNNLSGVVNFSNRSGSSGTEIIANGGANGSLTFTTSFPLNTSSRLLTRIFESANEVGVGFTNYAPVSGNGVLNLTGTTASFTLSTPVSAVGFTLLQRDGTRDYTFSVRITDGITPTTISLGAIAYRNLPAALTSGDANAINYSHDLFVGYIAPTGFHVDQIIFGGGGNPTIDTLAYALAPIPEPSSVAVLAGLGALGFVAMRRRRRA